MSESTNVERDDRANAGTETSVGGVEVTINPPVFITSAVLLLAILAYGVFATADAAERLPKILDFVSTYFGWLYVLSVAGFIAFAVWILLSPYATLRLGDDDDEPDFSALTWFSMLFSAGMGIGLIFYGVAEPITHYNSPPSQAGGTLAAARAALPTTFFHWGLHAWSIYALMGLSIAYFSFRKKLPLALRSCFYPLLGERIYGWPGHLIDILAVFGTLFGLATSLGLGSMQVSAGLNYLFGIPHTTTTQLILIGVITLAATVSLVTGVEKGIRRLSELNLTLAGLLMLFVIVVGPTLFIVNGFVENIGGYLGIIVSRTFRAVAMTPEEGTWLKNNTLFYWGWWIAWSPFVGMFVARVSRGRTIREFILGVLLVPTAVTMVWFSVFGDTAIYLERFGGGGIVEAVNQDVSTAIYVTLERLPLSTVTSALAAMVVAVFFVTSSDSASFVVDMLTSGGHPDPPIWQRVFWASAEGACAAVLLYAGGSKALTALQAAVVSIGLPFCLVIIVMCFSLYKALREEDPHSPAIALAAATPGGGGSRQSTTVSAVAGRDIPSSTQSSAARATAGKDAPIPPQEGPMQLDKVLVPVDYSAASRRAITVAVSLAEASGDAAKIEVLHVVPRPVDYLPLDEWIYGERGGVKDVDAKIREAANAAFQEFLASLPDATRERVDGTLVLGVPYRSVLERTEKRQCDLVVMGARGRSSATQHRLGSVTERVVRYSSVPVLTVP